MAEKNSNSDYQKIINQAKKLSVLKVSLNSNKELISEEEKFQLIKIISNSHGLSNQHAFIAISLLFLKRACNSNASKNMSVAIKTKKVIPYK